MAKRGAAASLRRGSKLGCAVQGCVLAMLPLCVGLAFAVVMVFDISRTWSPVVLGVTFGGWFLMAAMAVGIGLFRIVTRRNRNLDAAFTPLGLRVERVGMVQRGFVGDVLGRPVHGWFSKGPQLELYVGARLGRRVGIGRTNVLSRGVGRALAKESAEVGEGLQAWSDNAEEASRLLALAGVRESIVALCTDLPGAATQLHITPDALKLHVRYFMLDEWSGESDLTPDRVQHWMTQLIALAEALETLPPGNDEETPLERRFRVDRAAIFRKSLGCAFGIVGVTLVLAMVAGIAVALFTAG
jgi:hypothetical protein